MGYLKQHITGFIGGVLVIGLIVLTLFTYSLSKVVAMQGLTLQDQNKTLQNHEAVLQQIVTILNQSTTK